MHKGRCNYNRERGKGGNIGGGGAQQHRVDRAREALSRAALYIRYIRARMIILQKIVERENVDLVKERGRRGLFGAVLVCISN